MSAASEHIVVVGLLCAAAEEPIVLELFRDGWRVGRLDYDIIFPETTTMHVKDPPAAAAARTTATPASDTLVPFLERRTDMQWPMVCAATTACTVCIASGSIS